MSEGIIGSKNLVRGRGEACMVAERGGYLQEASLASRREVIVVMTSNEPMGMLKVSSL